MKFSICIPTHRPDRLVLNTLESLRELEGDFEICLSLEGSRRYVWEIDPLKALVDRIEYHEGSSNIATAKNRALAMAQNDWVILMDHDDFLLPSALNQYSRFISQNPDITLGSELSSLNMLGAEGSVRAYYPETPEQHRAFYQNIMNHNELETVPGWGRPLLFKRSAGIRFDETNHLLEDRKIFYDLWGQGIRVAVMPTLTYLWNWNPLSASYGTDPSRDSVLVQHRKAIWKSCQDLVTKPNLSLHADFYPLTQRDLEFIQKVVANENKRRIQ